MLGVSPRHLRVPNEVAPLLRSLRTHRFGSLRPESQLNVERRIRPYRQSSCDLAEQQDPPTRSGADPGAVTVNQVFAGALMP